MNTVVLEVSTLTETLAGVALTMQSGQTEQEARLAFATPELLWRVLTVKRWQLIKVLCDAGSVSIREAARRLERDVKAVHRDVTALLNAGVLNRTTAGKIEFPYRAVKVEFLLQAA